MAAAIGGATVIVTCTSCARRLSVPDSAAGKHGKCPACRAVIAIPKAEPGLELMEVGAGSPATRGARRLPSDPPEVSPEAVRANTCPSCGTCYPQGVVLCVPCGLEIATGRTIEIPAGGLKFRREPLADDAGPFWKSLAGIFVAPAATIQALPARMLHGSFALKTGALFAASLVLAALAMTWFTTREMNEREKRSAEVFASRQEWQPVSGSGPVRLSALVEPGGPLEPGETATVVVKLIEEPAGKAPNVDVWFRFVGGVKAEGAGQKMERGGAPGEFTLAAPVPDRKGGVSGRFEIVPRGALPGSEPVGVLSHFWMVSGSGSPSGAPARSVFGIFAIVLLIGGIFVVLGLALDAGLIKLAAKVLGDEGSWREMFFMTLFLYGAAIVTLSALSVLPSTAFWIGAFAVCGFMVVLNVRAVMAVFNQSGWKALGTLLLAGAFHVALQTALSMMIGFAGFMMLAGLAAGRR